MRTYRIRDASGGVVAEHIRTELPGGRKGMAWRVPGHPAADGLLGLRTADLPLYGTHLLAQLEPGRTVVVTEGEKAAEALWSLRLPAVGTVTGAASTPGEDALSVLLPYDVVTWEDHDEAGTRHMERLASALRRLGGSARRLIWSGASEKGDDAADFVARGGTRVTAELMLGAALPWVITVEPERQRAVRPAYERQDGYRVEQARSHLLQVVESKLGPHRKRVGRSLFWPCPFHAGDREPSFKVDTREPFFRCFGCGARGDVFTFLRTIEGVEFKDALRELAPPKLLGAAIPW